MSEYPPQVQRLHDALMRIPGVLRADTGITSVQGLTPEDLAQLELADLPHAALLRAPGLPDEAVVQVDLELEPSAAGWRALEFLAWSVKDLARSGQIIQIRPIALPPIALGQVQLGTTLRLLIDVFVTLDGSVEPALRKLDELSAMFETYLQLYDAALHGAA